MNTVSDLAARHPLLALAALTVAIAALCYGLAELFDWIDDRLETRSGIRDLEHFVNHPASHTRKEDR